MREIGMFVIGREIDRQIEREREREEKELESVIEKTRESKIRFSEIGIQGV